MTRDVPLQTLKQQLAQLDALIKEGVLTGDAAKNKRAALEAQVLRHVTASPGAASAATAAAAETPLPQPSMKLWAGVAVFVLVTGLAGYGWRGSWPGLRVGPGENVAASEAEAGSGAAAAAAAPTQAQVEEMVQRLADRLKEKPNDPTGWLMLARAYTAQGKFDQALPAFKRVVDLRPQDAQALADYADAMAVVNNQSLDGEPEQLVAKAMQLDPANVKALSLAGTVAFNKAQYSQAVSYWERAVQAADPASGFAAQLKDALDEARKRAGTPDAPSATQATTAAAVVASTTSPAPAVAPAETAAPAAPASPAAAAGGTVTGRVSLSAALQGKAAPGDTVFIFARAATGPRMPLAIMRKKVSDLPFNFVLDDSTAMSPDNKLSSAAQVVVGARISKSGNAMPQTGDLQGFSPAVAPGASKLVIEISDTVP
jgi:cytochrome c-type biogenesis protein CcmH